MGQCVMSCALRAGLTIRYVLSLRHVSRRPRSLGAFASPFMRVFTRRVPSEPHGSKSFLPSSRLSRMVFTCAFRLIKGLTNSPGYLSHRCLTQSDSIAGDALRGPHLSLALLMATAQHTNRC